MPALKRRFRISARAGLAPLLLALWAGCDSDAANPDAAGAAGDPSGPERVEAEPRLVLDPMGVLRFDDFEVHFPALTLPAPGRYPAAAPVADGVHFGRVDPESGAYSAASEGSLVLESCSAERVALVLELGGQEVRLDETPALRPSREATVEGRPPREPKAPTALPQASEEDLFFAALGSPGSGLPGQRRVAAGLAAVAPTGPLDFVLVLGDLFTPRGAESGTDPVFDRCFESVYDDPALDVPFHFAFGDREHEGNLEAIAAFQAVHRRFSAPAIGHSFEVESHGQRLQFVSVDTTSCLGDIRHPLTRRARSWILQQLSESTADWKVVYGHHPMYGNSPEEVPPEQSKLRLHLEPVLRDHGVHLYLAGAGRHQAVLEAKGGVTHVLSGAGGGPELAEGVAYDDDTLFATTGGGFVTVRFDGEALAVVVRDSDGTALYRHRIER